MPKYHGNRIVVPQRPIQGGFDLKFETDPYDVDLKSLLSATHYTDEITKLNDKLRRARSGAVDKILLATGPLIVPLALWGVRHSNQNRRRKRLLKKSIEDFNFRNPTLLMRWNRRPASMLTIERRPQEEAAPPQAMAEAQLVDDAVVPITRVDGPVPPSAAAPPSGTQANNHDVV